ncbi:hypothetical protein PHET_07382 [Paragonimus heterotremus]|uniref:B box-type domain-containing protein n=1 Tax=Paragonimus heterotremus TaxID=100268 RepID=A0A8J4SIK3_9TREM|nr:hypothetical protein PHET_07382 [Paragonimus heterotremus]
MGKKKQEETKNLENETKLMEQRLQLLKSVLQKDIPKLTTNEGGTSGTIWTGSLINSTTEATPKLKTTADSCQECNEDYCAKCFAQFHMKGALRRHHSLPLSSFTTRASVAKRKPIGEGSGEENAETNCDLISPRSVDTHGCEIQTSPITKHASCTAQTESHGHIVRSSVPQVHTETRSTSSERVSSPTIQFTPSITYAERLMLRVHRRNQLPALTATNTFCQSNCEPERMEPAEDFRSSSSFWQRPNFSQLHALATSNLRTEDFCTEFQMEDLENISNLAGPDVQHPTRTEMNIRSATERINGNAELSVYTTREKDTIQDDVFQNTTVIPKGDIPRKEDDSQSKKFVLNVDAQLFLRT